MMSISLFQVEFQSHIIMSQEFHFAFDTDKLSGLILFVGRI